MFFLRFMPFVADRRERRLLRARAERLYRCAVRQARQPWFYRDYGIPDTPEGRFEMIALHVWLLLHRLKNLAEAADLGQVLFDVTMRDMEDAFRELGVSDTVIGKRMKQLSGHFYGRLRAYDHALEGGNSFPRALHRNAYGRPPAPSEEAKGVALAGYCQTQIAGLAAQETSAFLEGRCEFTV